MKKIFLALTSVFVLSLTACDFANETSLKVAASQGAAETLSIARQNGCLNCHTVTSSIIGPAWVLVSDRYKDSPDARSYLIEKIKKGGSGAWNDITGGAKMPAHETRVSQAHIEQIVDFILSIQAVNISAHNKSTDSKDSGTKKSDINDLDISASDVKGADKKIPDIDGTDQK